MVLLGYGTPIREYMKENANSKIAAELALIVSADKTGMAR